MPTTKSQTARRLGISPQSVNGLIHNNRLEVVNVHGKEMVTDVSLYKEVSRRYLLFAEALMPTLGSCECGCGCSLPPEKTKNRFIQGHDQALESTIRTIVKCGSELDRDYAATLAIKHNIDIKKFYDTNKEVG